MYLLFAKKELSHFKTEKLCSDEIWDLGCPPAQDSSHHQEYDMFKAQGSQPKPLFATGILGIWYNPIWDMFLVTHVLGNESLNIVTWNHSTIQPFNRCSKLPLTHQVIQAVTFSSPNVGGHQQPFKRVKFSPSQKGHQQNCQASVTSSSSFFSVFCFPMNILLLTTLYTLYIPKDDDLKKTNW